MKKRISFCLIIFLFVFCSCSDNIDDKDKKAYIEITVETLSSTQLVNMLLIENNFDFQQLSRVLGCSVYTLQRIQSGETVFSPSGELQVKVLLKDILFEGSIRQHDSEKGFWKWFKYGTFWSHSYNDNYKTSIDLKWEELVEK